MKIIAEFCQNHNGDFDLLKKMIVAAAEAGATHGKMQTIYARNLAFRPEFENGLEIDGKPLAIKRPFQPEYDRMKQNEVAYQDVVEFVKICKDNGIKPMTTCFARENIDEISEAGFDSIKIASYDCGSYQLLRELKDRFSEIVISTGATFDEEIKGAAETLSSHQFSMLHCVTQYPTPLESMNLARMQWLKQFTDEVGLSDHSLVARDGVWACKAAIHLGAKIVERHFTILPVDQTKDGPVSITADDLKDIVRFNLLSNEMQREELDQYCPNWNVMIGTETRTLTEEELLNRHYYRGRFASRRAHYPASEMIYNWEETSI